MHTVTFSDARKHFADTMSRVTNNAEPVRVMRRDAPDIVMVDAGEYEAMLETLYLFSTPANAAHLNESLAQLERGEVVTVDYSWGS
jgi:antitoxin YefM